MNKKSKNLNKTITQMVLAVLLVLLSSVNSFSANHLVTSYSFSIVPDTTAPYVESCSPGADANNVPVHTNIQFCLKDDNRGIDSGSIDLSVEGVSIIADGNIQTYENASGQIVEYDVEIIEKSAGEYVVAYDPSDYFMYKQDVDISLNVSDLDGNAMTESAYSFETQKFIYGQAKKFSKSSASLLFAASIPSQDNPCVATSNNGKNVYIVWEEVSGEGNWDIYLAKSSDFGVSFGNAVKVNRNETDIEHRYPAIAVDVLGNVYVAWQQKSLLGDWDIYIAVMESGDADFSDSYLVYDDSGVNNQMYPAIDVGAALTDDGDSETAEPSTIYLSWVDENSGVSRINYTRTTAAYNDSWYEFVPTAIRVDDDRLDQNCAAPRIDVNDNGTVFIGWNGINQNSTYSIYFDKADRSGIDCGESFGNDVVVSNATAGAQGPVLQADAESNTVYIAWEERGQYTANVEFAEYVYSQAQGTYSVGTSSQVNAAALTNGTLGGYDLKIDNNGNVLVVWEQELYGSRTIGLAGASNQDYQFKEYSQFEAAGENCHPSFATNPEGCHYYISWADTIGGSKEISFCRNTFMNTETIEMEKVESDTGGTVSISEGDLAGTAVTIEAGSVEAPLQITVAKVVAAPSAASDINIVDSVVDFGPGGTEFSTAATITIPYTDAQLSAAGITSAENLKIYYYNLATTAWEEVNGANVDMISKIVSVETLHFSMYAVGAAVENESAVDVPDVSDSPVPDAAVSSSSGGGGGGGGCFIATAAFGTKMAKEVRVLCEFRDSYLLTNKLGRKFVKLYYTYSPPIADYIAQRPALRSLIRASLKPLITLSRLLCS
ncbi:MAG: Ig-like domain-containing protein [Candidatus Omnitrophota bacterium]